MSTGLQDPCKYTIKDCLFLSKLIIFDILLQLQIQKSSEINLYPNKQIAEDIQQDIYIQQFKVQIQQKQLHIIFLQLIEQNITRMLQSFSQNFLKQNQQLKVKCHRCKQKPNQQFILLLCDHIICSTCLSQFNPGSGNQFDGVKCPCGIITYFKLDDSCSGQSLSKRILGKYSVDQQVVSGYTDDKQVTQHKRNRSNFAVNIYGDRNQRKTKQVSIRGSAGLIQSKNTASTKNISRLNTQSLNIPQTKLNDSLESNEQSRLRNKLLLQKSKYSVLSKQGYEDSSREIGTIINRESGNFRSLSSFKNKKEKTKNGQSIYDLKKSHYQPKYIQSQSLISEKQNLNPNNKKRKKNLKRVQNEQNSQQFSELSSNQQKIDKRFKKVVKNTSKSQSRHKKQNILTDQLKSQINFLRVAHKKALQDLHRSYSQALNKINLDFEMLQGDLQDLCLQAIALNKNQSHINFSKIIKIRYETFIANNIQKLKQQIKRFSKQSFNSNNIRSIYNSCSKQERKQRYSSPQHEIQTQLTSIYPIRQQITSLHQGYKQKVMPYCSHQYNIPSRYTISSTQNGCKLQKKGIKKRTNITIQL